MGGNKDSIQPLCLVRNKGWSQHSAGHITGIQLVNLCLEVGLGEGSTQHGNSLGFWFFFFNCTCITALGDDTLQTLVLQALTFCVGVSGRFPKQLF